MRARFTLIPLALALIVTLAINVYLFTQQNNLTNQINTLSSQNLVLQDDKATLHEKLSQLSPRLTNSKGWLVTSLGITDVTSFLSVQGVPRLFIQGAVSNVGNCTAYGCVLYVKIYQSGVLTYEVYRCLGNIESGSHVDVYENIVYTGRADTGSALSSWEVFPLFNETICQFVNALSG